MAHFARLDENNIVTTVTVVSNDDLLDDNGNEVEALGIAVCESVVGPGPWIQTSYNGTFRGRFAQPGHRYDETIDRFIAPQPYPSWVLDENYEWNPPVPMPDDGALYGWDEKQLMWVQAPGADNGD